MSRFQFFEAEVSQNKPVLWEDGGNGNLRRCWCWVVFFFAKKSTSG